MAVHLVNPNDNSFGIGIIVPRWLYVLAAATPERFGVPSIVDETLDPFDPASIRPGDVVGIGIHTLNALRGYEVGRLARERGAHVIYGGIHASLYPEEPFERGAASAVVRGDGDLLWGQVLEDSVRGTRQRVYEGGRIDAALFFPARWQLLPADRYMIASVQTVRGCPKHCSFCSVWRTDGQKPRQRAADVILEEVVQLRRTGFRFILLADDNFYPVTKRVELAAGHRDTTRLQELSAIRNERFELMDRLSRLPPDTIFFTQITMEAADDPEYLEAMKRARVKGALVGIESVTAEGLKAVYKEFNSAGDDLVEKLRAFVKCDVRILGSFIFGLSTDRPDTFAATASLAQEAGLDFAQFVTKNLSGNGGLPGMAEIRRGARSERRRHSLESLLAHSQEPAAEALPAPSGDVPRGDPGSDPGGLEPLLPSSRGLEAIGPRREPSRSGRLRPHLEALPPDVRE
jgi:radical SAM superfamily enzyme YgiQ (UPF0313 family)